MAHSKKNRIQKSLLMKSFILFHWSKFFQYIIQTICEIIIIWIFIRYFLHSFLHLSDHSFDIHWIISYVFPIFQIISLSPQIVVVDFIIIQTVNFRESSTAFSSYKLTHKPFLLLSDFPFVDFDVDEIYLSAWVGDVATQSHWV